MSSAASHDAVARAIGWHLGRGAFLPEPLPAEPLLALERAWHERRPLPPELFELLVRCGQLSPRCAELGAPPCNLGDALAAAATLPPEAPLDWRFDPALDAESFAKLRFREVSAGIARAERAQRDGWRAHAERCRGYIAAAIERLPRHELAVVLGAGQAFDLPLATLAACFARVVVIDVDGAALGETLARDVPDPGLRARLEPRVQDLTGVNGAIVRRLDEALDLSGSADDVEVALGRVCRSYRLPAPPAWLPGERADLVVSAQLLTQLAWPQRPYALGRFAARFGRPVGSAERRWIAPFWELELRLQQDHVAALATAADAAVLVSDVVSLATSYGAAGAERPTGLRVQALGVDHLADRVPQSVHVDERAAWRWPRYRPDGHGRAGALMEVEALRLRAAA